MKTFITILLTLIMLSACSKTDHRLIAADSLMESAPDSALTILSGIEPERLTKEDFPYYALLYTQAQIKNWIEVDNDTLFKTAYTKYRNSDNVNLRMRTFFYQAQIDFNRKDQKRAIKNILVAYEIAKEEEDLYWTAKSAEIIGDIYFNVLNYLQAEKFTAEAAGLYKKTGRIASHRYALCDLATTYFNVHKFEEAKAITDSLAAIVQAEEPLDSALMGYIYDAAVPLYYMSGQISEIENVYNNYLYKFYKGKDNIYNTLVRSYIAQNRGQQDLAQTILDYASGLAADKTGRAQVKYAEYHEALTNREYEKAALLADSIIALQGELAWALLSDDVSTISSDFYNAKSEENENRANLVSKLLYMSISVAIVIVSLIIIIYRLRLNKKKVELENQIASFLLLKSQFENANKRNENLSQALQNCNRFPTDSLLKEKWETLDKLCSEYFELSDSNLSRTVILNRIEQELQSLRSSDYLKKIETSVDNYLDGIIEQMKVECHFLKDDDFILISLISAGLSPRAICYLAGVKYKNYYLRRSRIIEKIDKSEVAHKERFLKLFSKERFGKGQN